VPSFCETSRLRVYAPGPFSLTLEKTLQCSPLVAALLEMRGFDSEGEIDRARAWISPSLDSLMDEVDLGKGALLAKEEWLSVPSFGNVVVYGDYDVDGISATVLAVELAKYKSREVRYFIPERHSEGYGIHRRVVSSLAEMGCNTLIVVDCGTKDGIVLEEASRQGIRVIVFDHHTPGEVPPYRVTVNPQIDGNAAGKRLCAASLLWAWAWIFEIVPRSRLSALSDLAALATIADCMPLDLMNRAIVRSGICRIRHSPRPGIMRLIRRLGLELPNVNEEHLAMKVIPCLNAAGRLECADTAVNVMLGASGMEEDIETLIALNRKRQTISSRLAQEIGMQREREGARVLFGEDWPIGVLSGVASRLCNEKSTPIVLAAPTNGSVRGTLRVPEGGNAMEILDTVSGDLLAWGGHRYAAGFSVSSSLWNSVRDRLEGLLETVRIVPPAVSALAWNPADITLDEWESVGCIAPFGTGNPCPLFFFETCGNERIFPLGKTGEHVRIDVDGVSLLAFNGTSLVDRDDVSGYVFHPRIDMWRGSRRIQFILDHVVVGN
jgi:single-stranded-DNA-specific exonuclease